jgi:3-hydroxyacyl-CoA dehydrogenase/enoyl-CoA hydratase/3-hydroxybutyryl-CoA epimerase
MSQSNPMNSAIFRLERRFEEGSHQGPQVWALVFDLPGEKVNKLSREVMEAFQKMLPELQSLHQGKKLDAVVLVSGKPGNFVAGADIKLIQSAKSEAEAAELAQTGQKLLNQWEDLPFVKVAAIAGAALGGGCELALGCDAIVMSRDSAAKIGLPEVLLGLLPGMGGCVRLPRRVGLANALDLILTGKTLNAERAAKIGLCDAVIEKEDFETAAVGWVTRNFAALSRGERLGKKPALGGGAPGPLGSALEHTPMGRAFMLSKAKEGVLKKTKGQYPSPLEIISVMKDTGGCFGEKLRGQAREVAMAREAQGFGRCAASEVSKYLIGLFFLTEAVKKDNGLGKSQEGEGRRVGGAAVLGAGVMGGGIAQLLAEKEIPVRMKDLNSGALAAGMSTASAIFKKQVKRRRITSRQMLQKMNFIAPITNYSGFKSVDLVIEAIVENMDVKKKVLAELESQVTDHAVIASNTSSLSISEMQKALQKPERFVGLHFFNPVAKMPLIEVIRGARSSDEAVMTAFQFSKKIGKTPVVVKDAPGFLVNRLLMPYLNEATWLVSEGAPVEWVDRILEAFGMPMGPMELIDEVGVDVGEKVAHILHDAFGDRVQPAPNNGKIVAAGRLGKKNGKGIYVYSEGGRKKNLDPEIYSLIGVVPNAAAFTEQEVLDRCVLPMINEASRCLEESVVASADELDLAMIMGTGFPPFRGGLLHYADRIGAQELVSRLEKYAKKYGARYEPAPLLRKMALQGKGFYDLFGRRN